tara:strand:- start:1344 stop:1919 length:576 start_codon:yes stop_codon:yes gene_type:complete
MSYLEEITNFWKTNTSQKFTIDDLEVYLQNKYNIYDSFVANELFYGQILDYSGRSRHLSNDTKYFIHNEDTICLLFPEYAVRIAVTQSYLKNLPYFLQILSGDWKDAENVIQKEYYCEVQNKMIKASKNIICRDIDLQSILYDKPLVCQARQFQSKNYFTIQTVTCNNLYDSLILCNKLMFETDNFILHED